MWLETNVPTKPLVKTSKERKTKQSNKKLLNCHQCRGEIDNCLHVTAQNVITNTRVKQDVEKKKEKTTKKKKRKERTMNQGDCNFTTRLSSKENKPPNPKTSLSSYLLQKLSKNTHIFWEGKKWVEKYSDGEKNTNDLLRIFWISWKAAYCISYCP